MVACLFSGRDYSQSLPNLHNYGSEAPLLQMRGYRHVLIFGCPSLLIYVHVYCERRIGRLSCSPDMLHKCGGAAADLGTALIC